MKIEMILKPCPWCKQTPEIRMPIGEDTWRWHVQCIHDKCAVKPGAPYVSIRKTSKTDFIKFHEKLCIMASNWNHGNPCVAKDKKVIDVTKIAVNESWKLGGLDPWFLLIKENAP